MSGDPNTAVERVLRAQQRLAEKRIAEADEVSKARGDEAARDALHAALEDYNLLNPEPQRMCAICGKHPASEPHPYDYGAYSFMERHLDHVCTTFG